MKVILPDTKIITECNGLKILKHIETCGKTCYKSEQNITDESCKNFVKKIISNGHESVLEHYNITVKFICDRGVSHEIVRHRIASYSQESTRYCNYSLNKFENQLTFIKPCFWSEDSPQYRLWYNQMNTVETLYNKLTKETGATAEEARSILPNSLKTELIATMNLREWRHFFLLRTSPKAHPQMREVAIPLLKKFQTLIPIVFDDINEENI